MASDAATDPPVLLGGPHPLPLPQTWGRAWGEGLIAAALLMTLLCLGPVAVAASERDSGADEAQDVEITLVHDTHFHGGFFRADGVTLAHYVGAIHQVLDGDPHAFFIGNGDDLAPSVMSAVFFGEHMVDALNAAGLDVDTFGNHEFDYGPENLARRVAESQFPWVSANVLDRRTGEVFAAEAGARPYVLREAGGVTVGFTGLAPAETGTVSNAGPDVVVLHPVEAMGAMVPRMRAAGAQIIVVLSHLAGPDSDALAEAVSGIDVIVGDHAGKALDWPQVINGAIVSRRGQEYAPPGMLRLTVRAGRIVDFSYVVLPLASDSPVAPEVEQVVGRYAVALEVLLSEEIGSTATDLDARRGTLRREEAAIGNYIADALRRWAGAEVGLQNAGGIRGDKVYAAGSLTRGSIVEMLPFQNSVTVLRVKGAQLLEALENGVSQVEIGAGRFPQVSGLSFRYDSAETPRVQEVRVDGQPLDPDREYTLATNEFVASGGDGYAMLQRAEVLVSPQSGPLISLLVMEAVARDGVIAPRVEGRIIVGSD